MFLVLGYHLLSMDLAILNRSFRPRSLSGFVLPIMEFGKIYISILSQVPVMA